MQPASSATLVSAKSVAAGSYPKDFFVPALEDCNRSVRMLARLPRCLAGALPPAAGDLAVAVQAPSRILVTAWAVTNTRRASAVRASSAARAAEPNVPTAAADPPTAVSRRLTRNRTSWVRSKPAPRHRISWPSFCRSASSIDRLGQEVVTGAVAEHLDLSSPPVAIGRVRTSGSDVVVARGSRRPTDRRASRVQQSRPERGRASKPSLKRFRGSPPRNRASVRRKRICAAPARCWNKLEPLSARRNATISAPSWRAGDCRQHELTCWQSSDSGRAAGGSNLAKSGCAVRPAASSDFAGPWPDHAVATTHPTWHAGVDLRLLQRLQYRCLHAHHLVNGPAARPLHPANPGLPRTVALVHFPCQQMSDGPVGQSHDQRSPWSVFRHPSIIRYCVRGVKAAALSATRVRMRGVGRSIDSRPR